MKVVNPLKILLVIVAEAVFLFTILSYSQDPTLHTNYHKDLVTTVTVIYALIMLYVLCDLINNRKLSSVGMLISMLLGIWISFDLQSPTSVVNVLVSGVSLGLLFVGPNVLFLLSIPKLFKTTYIWAKGNYVTLEQDDQWYIKRGNHYLSKESIYYHIPSFSEKSDALSYASSDLAMHTIKVFGFNHLV